MSWGKGAKLLLFVFCFTMLFSVAELGAGIVSKSLLLVEESVHMFADSISFGISLWAETRIASDPTRSQKANLFGTGISLLTLTFTMCAVFFESIRRLVNFKDHGVVVNSSIMLVFGIILCCFHAMCLFMYFAGFSVHSGHGHSHDGGDHGKKQAKVDCEEDSEDESEKQDKCCGSDVELASSHGHSNCDHSHSHGHGHGHGHAHAHSHDHQPIHNHDHAHNHRHDHHHTNEPKEDQDFQEIDLSVIQPLQDEDDHDQDHEHDHHCDHGHEHSHECSHGHSHSCCGFDHTSLNMASAVFHIFIDFLHSFFVVVTALILRVLDQESSLTGTVDAIASLLLTFVIGGGVFVIGRELFDQIAKFRGYNDVMSKESASPIELANETIGNPNDASDIRVVATA